MQMLEFYASASPGTERALCEELRELGFASARLNRGGIPFRGTWREGWRACLQSRIAQRVFLLLGRFAAPDAEALAAGIGALDWRPYLTPRQTFAVASVCRGAAFAPDNVVTLKAKDALVDRIRADEGARPSVSRDDPDVRVFVYLVDARAAVYLDLAGEALHRRGYRTEAGEAPLRETLAAAILRLSGWNRRDRLADPMCGSGTIAIEAALWAGGAAPGLGRERFGFERWANFGAAQAEELRCLRGEMRRGAAPCAARIVASDVDPDVLGVARRNARAAGVRLAFRERSAMAMQADGEPGIVVTNPPYGMRLRAGAAFCRETAAAFSRLHGWRVCILAGSPEYRRQFALRPRAVFPLANGDLPCEFLIYDVS
ncbi:MAG: RNA methyltransferase [Lentisphaerae bacterium]|nr:RNA methyltransferase [Lentisphaerota bacterium]